MSKIGRVLILIYLLIVVLWIANSQYLFSFGGVTFWLLTIILGFVVNNLLSDVFLKKLIKISNYIMLFLVAITAAIFYITSSMP
jgi:hypothetical protein